jgi:hypothetical protein
MSDQAPQSGGPRKPPPSEGLPTTFIVSRSRRPRLPDWIGLGEREWHEHAPLYAGMWFSRFLSLIYGLAALVGLALGVWWLASRFF